MIGGALFLNAKIDSQQALINSQQVSMSEMKSTVSQLSQTVSDLNAQLAQKGQPAPQIIMPTGCGNGKCESGENLLNCSADCFHDYCLAACQEQGFKGYTKDCSSKSVGEKFEAPDHAGTCCCTNEPQSR